jgi:hypothetical protein
MGALTPEERAAVRARSPVGAKYDTPVNRESAHEILARRGAATAAPAPGAAGQAPGPAAPAPGSGSPVSDFLFGTKRRQGMVETMAKQAARTMGSQVGRQILRGLLGGILGGSKRR